MFSVDCFLNPTTKLETILTMTVPQALDKNVYIVPAKPHIMRANEHTTFDNISETIMHFVITGQPYSNAKYPRSLTNALNY